MSLFWKISALLAVLAVTLLSLQPPGEVQSLTHADKVQHFLAYAGICGLAALGWDRTDLWRIVLVTALFGLGIEAAQGLMGLGRTASVLDALANLAGAVCAAFVARFIRK